MSEKALNDPGFGIIEVIISMFLLAVIAVALLPGLWQGIQYSAEQSSVATATRHLNSLVEEARHGTPTCGSLLAVAAARTVTDGRGETLTSSGVRGACTPGSAVTLDLAVVNAAGETLANTSAIVYVK